MYNKYNIYAKYSVILDRKVIPNVNVNLMNSPVRVAMMADNRSDDSEMSKCDLNAKFFLFLCAARKSSRAKVCLFTKRFFDYLQIAHLTSSMKHYHRTLLGI